MKKSILLLTLFLSTLAPSLFAMPAVPWPVEKQLPDGTVVSIYIRGDERVNWLESPDGYTLLYDIQKNLVYAKQDNNGDMIPSDILYTGDNAKSIQNRSIEKGLRFSSEQVEAMLEPWHTHKISSDFYNPVKGDKKALCILVGFSDVAFAKTIAEFEQLMNQVGYSEGNAWGSVKDYYREVSYNQMDLTVTVTGVYTLPNTAAYYAKEDNYQEFARTAIELADIDIDFNDFANDNGRLETVHIIYAGYADNVIGDGQQIWPHKWEIDPSFELDGVEISTYSCSSELRGRSGSDICGIGTICHELCHVFGAPDYYDTDYAGSGGSYSHTGRWDLMASGGSNYNGDCPAHINMFQKILFGWVEPIYLTEPVSVTDMPNSAENPVAYMIEVDENEFYILENRQHRGFDVGLPGYGMIIYHLHPDIYDISRWAFNNINASHPQLLYVVSAAASSAVPNSAVSSYGDSANAAFGVLRGETFSALSIPAMFTWGTMDYVTDKPITGIRDNMGLVSFDFKMQGSEDCPGVQNIRAETGSDYIRLDWDAPDGDGYTYDVYYQSVRFGKDLSESGYTYLVDEYGAYTFCIVAKTDDCESYPAYINVYFGAQALSSFYPENSTNVDIASPIYFVFNKDIIVDDLSLPYIINSKGEKLDGVTAEAAGKQLNILHPDFEYYTQYHVVIPASTIQEIDAEIKKSFWTIRSTALDDIANDARNKTAVYPTITAGVVNIVAREQAVAYIMDLSGRILESRPINKQDILILDYADGIYLLSIETASGTSAHKIIIRR